MILTTEQLKVFEDELQKRGALNGCILCGGKSFSLGNYVFELRSYTEGKTVEADMPLIPLICDNCGHTLLINAKALDNRRLEGIASGSGVFLDFRERAENKNGCSE
jgi:DNA-directed RNA polymerase subunit RPC12/RpoP